MRPTTSLSLSLLSTLLLLPISTLAAFTGEAEADGVKFDFTQLKTHSVVVEHKQDPTVLKSNYTINPTGKLEVIKDEKDQCPDGTQVCMISRLWRGDKPDDGAEKVIPFGSIESPKDLEPEYTIMRDEEKKVLGLNVTFHGPEYGDKKQSAIVKFLCDPELTGLEEPDKDGKGTNALKFISYEGEQVATLEWRTKYACEKVLETPAPSQGSWGFFTWFIVIAFLVVAAYLIFGSWFNYNKYGARGWDLLPHSDTLRDLPYLIKDFLRRAVNTFQGSGGRGGYSAI
ncbi:hypothetical protein TWF718_002483 [Orbilia javanica]|uniref:Autophagy-related protein 27 n=1 Tax=Orbilia javanica TaxID=47235 RepID=A0AAN8MIV4_9PEZI